MKLSFKEYLDSKKRLLEVINVTPIQRSTYEISKYCKLVLHEDEVKQTVLLKPGHQLVVEWRYDHLDDPTPISIIIEDVKKSQMPTDVEYSTHWTGKKLQSWILKNTKT